MEQDRAYYELLERHRRMVWNLCRRAARGDWDRTNDLVQEVSIALWERFGQLRPDASPQEERAWVRWQARSVLDLQRRKQHLATVPLTDEMAEIIADEETSDKEMVEEVMELLTPEEQRMVRLKLCGYDTREVAKRMHLTPDAVYQRMHRIILKARRALLVMALLLGATTVAVAVVPQWHRTVFGGEPAAADSTPQAPPASAMPRAAEERQWVTLDTLAVDPPRSGFSWQYLQDSRTLVYIRYAGTYAVRAMMHNVDSTLFTPNQIPYTMYSSTKQAAIAATVAVLTVAAASAQPGYDFQTVSPQGDTLFCTVTDSAAHLVSLRGDTYVQGGNYIRYGDTLVLPSVVEHEGVEYTVTALADSAFCDHSEVKAVIIPSTVGSIGRSAFRSTGIFELEVPDSVNAIGENAFHLIRNAVYHGAATGAPWGALTLNAYEQDRLLYLDSTRTVLTASRPDLTQADVPSSVRTIGRFAFLANKSLVGVTLHEGLDTIGRQAFANCSKLGSLTIPSTVRSIGNYAFYNAFRRTGGNSTVTIADAECTIGEGAFAYSYVAAVDLGTRVTSIGTDAFSTCYKLDSVTVPASVTYLGPRVFCYNYNGRLKKVRLPEGLDTIRAELLHGNPGLREVNIPASVVYIDSMAFLECERLTELTLPTGLTFIGEAALAGCSRVARLTSLATVPPQACPHTFDMMQPDIPLTVPCGSAEAYRNDPYWSRFEGVEEDCNAVPEAEADAVRIVAMDDAVTVEGAEGELVRLYDAAGRLLAQAVCHGTCRLPLPAAGLYLVQVGERPARKVTLAK